MSDRPLTAIRLPTGPTMVEAVERVWEAGEAVLPIDPSMPAPAVERLLRVLRPASLVQPREGEGVSRQELPDAQPVGDGTALVVPTSGSSGRPKGVELTHAALRAAVDASIDRLGCEQGDGWLLSLPLHHVAGLLVLLRARRLEAELDVRPQLDADGLGASDARWVSLVPTQLVRLCDQGGDLSGLDGILLGGAPPTDGLLERAEAAGGHVVVSYGLTETCGGCVYDGRPLDGVEVDVGGDGRILIRGPVLMRGYRGRADLTARALRGGWLRTADRGRITDDGRLEVLGRLDDVIVTGGENVSADGVAAVLRAHPDLAEAAVTSRPDDRWGEVVVAVLVPADGAEAPPLEELRSFASDQLPTHALPVEAWTVDELPRTDMGTVSRPGLADLAARRAGD